MSFRSHFGNKDENNFREALKLYEAKQYKKTIKTLDSILKRNPKHYESVALKGLALHYSDLPEKKEAEDYILRGSSRGSTNPVVCHVTGLYYRALKNYADAAKWYQSAMENNSQNKGILRDLSSCLSQTRDYKHLVKARLDYLEDQPAYRANWTAAAVAHYLNGQYKNAENVLTKIEELIAGHLSDNDLFEHSECLLFKNRAIAASGDTQRALDNLETIEKDGQVTDGLKLLEYKAEYLEALDRPAEASKVYRKLLKRNPDDARYYYSLERTLGTDKMGPNVRLALYEKLAQFYPRADPAKFIPLTFLTGDAFKTKATEYLLSQLKRGVPATFVNVKPLYRRKSNRQVLLQIAKDFYDTVKPGAESADPLLFCWTGYFLAQHYYRVGDYASALEYINTAIETTPTLVELYIVKARILKRTNKLEDAAAIMDHARKLDLQDRFINSKSTKYFLRSNQLEKAVDTASLFTRNDGAPNGVQDLHMMQCVWFLTESAECYFRLYKESLAKWNKTGSTLEGEEQDRLKKEVTRLLGLALKRYRAVIKVFDEYRDDQFDFHHYSMRKGTPTTYLTMLAWEDRLYQEPIFLRSAVGITRLYLEVSGNKEKFQELLEIHHTKRTKKEKKEDSKHREELVKYSKGYADDDDIFGDSVLRKLAGLDKKHAGFLGEELSTLASKVECDTEADALYVMFRANQYLQKYVLSLSALNKTHALDAGHHNIAAMYLELTKDMGAETTQPAIKKILQLGLSRNFASLKDVSAEDLPKTLSESYLKAETLAGGISAIESSRIEESAVFSARAAAIQKSLDPYEAGYLDYYKIY